MSKDRSVLSRRVVVGSAGTAGALAAAAALLPSSKEPAKRQPEALAQRADVGKGGYQETPHVLHYYRTARV